MQKYMRSGSRYRFGGGGGKKWIAIVLALVMFGAGFLISKMTVGGGLDTGNFQTSLYQQMRNEAKNAVSYVNKLTRNNGSSSDYVTLSYVASSIHSLEVLNSLNVAVYGESGRIFTAEELTNAQTLVDNYYTLLTSGSKVTENLTLLSETVNSLYTRTLQLLGD